MRIRPSYANVVSTLALVLAVSGGAYAATQLPKDSVGSKQIKNNKVKSKDVRDGGIRAVDLRADVLADVVRDGDLADVVRDPELDAAVADLVGEAQLDDALAAALEDYVAGDRDDAILTLPGGSGHQPLVALPGVVSVTASCVQAGPTRGLEVLVTNDSAAAWTVAFRQRSEDPASDGLDSDTIPAGDDRVFVFAPDSSTPSARHLAVTALTGERLDIEVSGVTSNLAGGCNVRGSALRDGGPA